MIRLMLKVVLVSYLSVGAFAFVPCENAGTDGIALYHMNEGQGVTLTDSAGNDDPAQLVGPNPFSWTTGSFGSGLAMSSGVNAYFGEHGGVSLPSGILNQGTITIEMYLNYDYMTAPPVAGDSNLGFIVYDGGGMYLRGKLDTTNPARYYCVLQYGSRLSDGSWIDIRTPHEYALDAGQWTHVALTRSWDGQTATAKIYINGQLAVSGTSTKNVGLSGGDAYIGDPLPGRVAWGGQIDEVKISFAELDQFGCMDCGDWGYRQGDIDGDCYVGVGDLEKLASDWLDAGFTSDSNTDLLLHFEEAAGSTAYDSSGNSADGTLSGNDISWTSGKYGGGIQLTSLDNQSGDGSKITLPADLLSKTNFTVQMDVNWDYLAQFPVVGDSLAGFLFSGGGSNTSAYGKIDTSNPAINKCKFAFNVFTYAGVLTATTPSEFAIDANQWVNVAFTSSWEDVGEGVYNTVIRILINDQIAAEASSASGPIGGPGTPYIGRTDSSVSWGGQIDEVRILDYAIDPDVQMPCDGSGYRSADINQDCKVNFDDFLKLAEDWQECTDPDDPANCQDCASVVVEEFVVDADTLALWHMNEGSGDVFGDATGTYDMDNFGYIWSQGRFGNGLISKSYPDISYATAGPIPLTSEDPDVYEMSVSSWVKFSPPASSSGSYILSIDNPTFIRVASNGTSIQVGFFSFAASGTWMQLSHTPFGGAQVGTNTDWHHIGVVYDGVIDANNQIHVHLYWNGQNVSSTSVTVDPADFPGGKVSLVNSGDGMVYIGNNNTLSLDTAFYGSIDEVRISTNARDAFYCSSCE